MSEFITIQKQQVPVPGLGAYQLTGKEGESVISHAISLGYRHIDTAQFYHNEEEVGNAVKNSGIDRLQLFITTKIWPADFIKKNSISFVEQSLRKLKLNHVDLLLLHWPTDDDGNERGLDMLLESQHKQYARLIGVSNFNITQLEKARKNVSIFCNQVESSFTRFCPAAIFLSKKNDSRMSKDFMCTNLEENITIDIFPK